ncbi:MAG: general secretion pathway protein GspL [Sphingomonadales bacterium]|nr:MAG: general secretion pathway protein GspL [Sphingomonadales bacterium]
MRPAYEANVTVGSSAIGAPDLEAPRANGVWTLAGDRLIIVDAAGPATILVPTEQVRLLAVDLPLANRTKRLAALPFAIEDQIAEPVDSVHLALGAEIGTKRYLAGVVSHDFIARWIVLAEQFGLSNAAIVPDALSLPRPADGSWAVELSASRALVRSGEGTGFAIPASMLRAAWESAGRPPVTSYGAPPPEDMMAKQGVLDSTDLANPALDLRQGIYARRNAGQSTLWRRLGWVVALGAAAHVVIAAADTLMLRSIADRRAADTRALVATTSPSVTIGDDLVGEVTNLIPVGSNAKPDSFTPLVTRVSGALAPLAGSLSVRTMSFQADTLIMDLDGSEPGLSTRIDAALKGARIAGSVTNATDGSVRITARGA